MIQTSEEEINHKIEAAQALIEKLVAENSELVGKVWRQTVKMVIVAFTVKYNSFCCFILP